MRRFSLLLILVCVASMAASAQFIDPQFYFCGSTTQDACGGHPNTVPTGSPIFAFTNPAGNGPLAGWEVFLAIPANSQGTELSSYNNPLTVKIGTTTIASGLAAVFCCDETAVNSDAYTLLGFSPGQTDHSENYSNHSSFDLPILGYTPASFALFTYTVNAALGENIATLNFQFKLPVGTYVFGFGTDGVNSNYSTPFTNVAQVVPEPTSVLLLGTVLVGLGGVFRKKFRRA